MTADVNAAIAEATRFAASAIQASAQAHARIAMLEAMLAGTQKELEAARKKIEEPSVADSRRTSAPEEERSRDGDSRQVPDPG